MGYRTVVVLYNDQASEWENDPTLGKKIATAMNQYDDDAKLLPYGKVVECTHADNQTLAVLDGYGFAPVAHDHWKSGDNLERISVKLLFSLAEKLGYKLTKI